MPLPSKDSPFSENWFAASEKLADRISSNPGGDDINTDTVSRKLSSITRNLPEYSIELSRTL